jgi:hypothetical protein
MPVYFLPQFIVDLQQHSDANFARRVLEKIIHTDGISFRGNRDDHPFDGIEHAWIRIISRGHTAYRVIYLRYGEKIYLYRAGEHSIENRLFKPASEAIDTAIQVVAATSEIVSTLSSISVFHSPNTQTMASPFNRLRRNVPKPLIQREIFSRRNLPHKDIWLVAPFIDYNLLAPTAAFGKLLLDQVEDGAKVILVTAPPKDNNIDLMLKLAEREIVIYLYPRLHAKLYCFIFDENRRNDPGLQHGDRYSSLILLGSANLTSSGMALGNGRCNEELCYMIPEHEIGLIETYVTELVTRGYELSDARSYIAKGQWQKLENEKW